MLLGRLCEYYFLSIHCESCDHLNQILSLTSVERALIGSSSDVTMTSRGMKNDYAIDHLSTQSLVTLDLTKYSA